MDTDVFKTSSGSLKKFMTSYDQIRRRGKRFRTDIVLKTSDSCHIEDANLQRPEDAKFRAPWRHRICFLSNMFHLRRLEDIWFSASAFLIFDVLKGLTKIMVFDITNMFHKHKSSRQRSSVKMMLLKVLQNSQENTCVGLSFWKKVFCRLVKKRLT